MHKQSAEGYYCRNSQPLAYTDGWKYRLKDDFTYRLQNNFTIDETYANIYYSVFQLDDIWYIKAKCGCCWDGPTLYPDWKWMMGPSLIHDILHWLIQRGTIPEFENNLINKELEDVVLIFLRNR